MENEQRFFYTNSVETAVSQFDFTLKFMRQGTESPKGQEAVGAGGQIAGVRLPVVRDEFSVSMSPTHAKALLVGLAKAILDYEQNIGTIPMEKPYLERYAQMLKTLREQK